MLQDDIWVDTTTIREQWCGSSNYMLSCIDRELFLLRGRFACRGRHFHYGYVWVSSVIEACAGRDDVQCSFDLTLLLIGMWPLQLA